MKNLSLLLQLDRPNKDLSSVWAMMPPISPDPDPSLHGMDNLLKKDDEKGNKGSRFAKFINDSKELFNKSPHPNTMEDLSRDTIPSKLWQLQGGIWIQSKSRNFLSSKFHVSDSTLTLYQMFKSAVGFISLKERGYSWREILFKSVPCKFEASEGVGRMMEECSSLSICIEFVTYYWCSISYSKSISSISLVLLIVWDIFMKLSSFCLWLLWLL